MYKRIILDKLNFNWCRKINKYWEGNQTWSLSKIIKMIINFIAWTRWWDTSLSRVVLVQVVWVAIGAGRKKEDKKD
jgi:hypothetical protein